MVIPIDSIEGVVPGRTLDHIRVRGINWAGCHVGYAEVRRIGFTIVYATDADPEALVFVVTTDESYALTVREQAAFAEQVQGHAILGSVPHTIQRSSARGLAALPVWRDHTAIALLGVSALFCAVLGGFVFARFPGLSPVVELGFPGFGGVIRVGPKDELLRIAYAGLGILAVNGVLGALLHTRERAAGLWVLASGGVLQLALLAAAVLAFGRA